MPGLSEVAFLMDEWTRTENEAYAKVNASLHERLDRLQNLVMELLNNLDDMSRVIVEDEILLDTFLEARGVRNRIIYDHDGIPSVITTLHANEDLDSDTDEERQDNVVLELMDGIEYNV